MKDNCSNCKYCSGIDCMRHGSCVMSSDGSWHGPCEEWVEDGGEPSEIIGHK